MKLKEVRDKLDEILKGQEGLPATTLDVTEIRIMDGGMMLDLVAPVIPAKKPTSKKAPAKKPVAAPVKKPAPTKAAAAKKAPELRPVVKPPVKKAPGKK